MCVEPGSRARRPGEVVPPLRDGSKGVLQVVHPLGVRETVWPEGFYFGLLNTRCMPVEKEIVEKSERVTENMGKKHTHTHT